MIEESSSLRTDGPTLIIPKLRFLKEKWREIKREKKNYVRYELARKERKNSKLIIFQNPGKPHTSLNTGCQKLLICINQ